jgi:cytochrome c oxidase subunit 2
MGRLPPLLLLPLLAGCDTFQSMTGGDGQDGVEFNRLFLVFMVVSVLMFTLVAAFLAAAWFRRGGARQDGIDDSAGESRDPLLRTMLIGWSGLVAIGLVGLTLASFFADRGMADAQAPYQRGINVTVTANQWWWDISYQFADDPSKNVHTANELHLPVGVPARLTLKANDVIHSFWVPNLAGKQDLIPGRVNDLTLVPNKAGIFRGQCAEFCGIQHAHMALDVTVESSADFARWLSAQNRPAPQPTTALQRAGYAFFMNRQCSSCHAIAGTPASGSVAPDLTHLMSRHSLAAGTLPMGRGNLYAWVADPQGVKPGNNMPYIGLSADELHAVTAYLETLK